MFIEPDMVEISEDNHLQGMSDEQVGILAGSSPEGQRWRVKGFFQREQPQHELYLRTFFIGRYPVTVGEFREFLRAGCYRKDELWSKEGWRWIRASNRSQPAYWAKPEWCQDHSLPVVGVSWYEASAYCRWLCHQTGSKYRLPNELEWEKAARGSDGRLYPWGNHYDPSRSNIRDSGIGHTTPVGLFSPHGDSCFGCSDMVGNVSEWTASIYAPYPLVPAVGNPWTESDMGNNKMRVTRGGSWNSPAIRARTTARGMNDPWFADNDLGFRIALGA